jgi:thiamine-phosphate pyrophosphorylase
MRHISKLHYITTSALLAEQACKGGVDWIQLRLKNIGYADYKAVAIDTLAMCRQYNAILIINDNIELTLDIAADGVHVGKTDPLPPDAVAEMIKRGGIIGCTANTIEDILHIATKPASYIGLGPFRFTTTKQNLSPVLGVEGYRKIFEYITANGIVLPPIIGIGGIVESDVAGLLNTGLYGIAVSGAITNATNVQAAAVQLKKYF